MQKADVIIEMEKLHNLNSGLGQFCLHLGNAIQESVSSSKNSPKVKYYVPSSKISVFGEKNSILKKWHHRYFGVSTDCKIWHQSHQQSVYFPKNKKAKIILTVHDLNFLDKYEGNKRQKYLRKLQEQVDRAHSITVISDYTGKVLKENVDTGNKKVVRIYNGNTLRKFDNAKKPAFMNDEKYLFCIGIFSAKKNFEVLLPFIKQIGNLNLVIAGNHNTEYGQKIKEQIQYHGVARQVILPGEVSDEDRYWLFRNCTAFIFPSLSEGFGLPVIEAMSLGKPTFLSENSSLPEVGGQEAFYFKNFDPAQMTNEFRSRMNEFVFDIAKATRIIQHSEKFSWNNAAGEYLKLYKELL